MSVNDRPDLLFFFSDQHNGRFSGYAGHPLVKTPNLDRLAADGTAFDTAYTPCPLCVPARSALLTGQYPSHNGAYNNDHVIRSDQSTFLHALAAAGYETVLCGRMHFKGADQRHGFTKRIFGDITPAYPNGGIAARTEVRKTFGMGGCLNVVGTGSSPVLEYDRAVVEAAVEYLNEEHDRPQCIVVGTYGPHFPYIAPEELFELYHGDVSAPGSWVPEAHDPNPLVDRKRQRERVSPRTGKTEPVDGTLVAAARAAYFGMITEQDHHVGRVREQWEGYLRRAGREGVFVYSSDHGDTCGEHGVFGKQTFYEGSVRIPMIFAGAGIPAGGRIGSPVSLLDIGPTLCELGGATPPPAQDGKSLHQQLVDTHDDANRAVISEWVQEFDGRVVAARMVRQGRWKLLHFDDQECPDQLFDVESDSEESADLADENPQAVRRLISIVHEDWHPDVIRREFAEKSEHVALLTAWSESASPQEPAADKWSPPVETTGAPERIW